jgi:ATP-binding cassette subfamily C (CFTR/MRP) protein 1
MRSFIYANFGEMLNGLPSVRAFRAEARFISQVRCWRWAADSLPQLTGARPPQMDKAVDVENRCYFVTIVLQRWLGVRLDALGALLVLAISL